MQTKLCSFSYTAFTLAFIYLILFFLVVRYLLNLIKQGGVKKQTQKLFLVILIGHTVLRVVYFALFPLSSDSCEPTMQGNSDEAMSGAAWWIHLLSNIPAILFLMAFSVLVFTFARIYHKVLLAGVWFQERRFKLLTVILVLLNILALIATFGDWAYAASSPSSHLSSFMDMLLYCVLSVSFILAAFFLGYGALLFYQVQNIIRASSENATGSTGVGYSTTQRYTAEESESNANHHGYVPKTPTKINPNSNGQPHLGIATYQHDEGQQEGGYQPPTIAPGGINLSPGPRPTAPTGFGSPVAQTRETTYPISGFASPNLPIRNTGGSNGTGSLVAHSYVSNDGSYSVSVSPDASLGAAAIAAVADLTAVPVVGADGVASPSSATEKERLAPVALAGRAASGYASSVSPEYARLPNSDGGRTAPMGGSATPTDALVGSAPYEVQPQNGVPKKGSNSIARIQNFPQAPPPLSHSPEEEEEELNGPEGGEDDPDDSERARNARRDREAQIRGLTNSTHLPQQNGYSNAASPARPKKTDHGLTSVVAYRDDDSLRDDSTTSSNQVPLLPPAPSQPPNPMRKIAVIAAICTVCLLLRTMLLIIIAALDADFSWYTTLLYFLLAEILPLLAMLKVFNTPTPLVQVLGAGVA